LDAFKTYAESEWSGLQSASGYKIYPYLDDDTMHYVVWSVDVGGCLVFSFLLASFWIHRRKAIVELEAFPNMFLRGNQITNALFQILGKWLVAVLLRKLINASFEGNSWILELTQPTAPLLNFVSGYGLSFYDSIYLSVGYA